MTSGEVALLLARSTIGLVFVAHGVNHAFGGGGLAGTARWFDGLGMRFAPWQALGSAVVEIGAGAMLVAGLLTAPAAAALIGVCLVAAVSAHMRNGFFVFRDGYEYVMVLGTWCGCIALLGPGRWSLDQAVRVPGHEGGWAPGAFAAAVGVGAGAAALLAFWRPDHGRRMTTDLYDDNLNPEEQDSVERNAS